MKIVIICNRCWYSCKTNTKVGYSIQKYAKPLFIQIYTLHHSKRYKGDLTNVQISYDSWNRRIKIIGHKHFNVVEHPWWRVAKRPHFNRSYCHYECVRSSIFPLSDFNLCPRVNQILLVQIYIVFIRVGIVYLININDEFPLSRCAFFFTRKA